MTSKLEPRGVLEPQAAEDRFDLTLHPPEPDLVDFVEHFWRVRWDLRGREPHAQHTLPQPSVHLVVENDRSSIVGVSPGRFTRLLEGKRRVFGIKFRPAGFRPFLGSTVSVLTRREVPVADVFGDAGDAYVASIRGLKHDAETVDAATAFLRAVHPAEDETVRLLNGIVAEVVADRSITRVVNLVERFGLSERRLQRMFNEYVGIGPKWVIQRYRLIEAAERLAGGESIDSATLAQELGYFDQAHFIRDFRATVGRPPAEYARGQQRATA